MQSFQVLDSRHAEVFSKKLKKLMKLILLSPCAV
jgi:hypothetical protein